MRDECAWRVHLLRQSDLAALERLAPKLLQLSPDQITSGVRTGRLVSDPSFGRGQEGELGAFYAPFDWIDDTANVVLLGITPGMQQAEAALLEARRALAQNNSIPASACKAKQEASFKGDMREIAAALMDHFDMHRLFGLSSCSELFGTAASRVHYTSVFRYPVLQMKAGTWRNYSGARWAGRELLRAMVESHLVPELQMLPNAWLVPFGPIPAEVLRQLARRRIVDGAKILDGLNHPSGTQWNRHNCQLDRVDHNDCAPNVGCATIRTRSAALRGQVAAALAA